MITSAFDPITIPNDKERENHNEKYNRTPDEIV